MANFQLMRSLQRPASTKIVLLVLDGLGGLPEQAGGPTELEAAATPVLDQLAAEGTLGQTIPVAPAISPGSGPAHLALFGYDPIQFVVGRGVLEATGIGMKVARGDIAARGNLATANQDGRIIDRRAGRISTEDAAPLVERLNGIELPGVTVEARVAREYRIAIVMRGPDLSPEIDDADPLTTGQIPPPARARVSAAEHTAALMNQWIQHARDLLSDQAIANDLTLRGFSTNPELPQFTEIYGLNAACIAIYPMYKGLSHLLGMDLVESRGSTPEEEFETLAREWERFDFFFVHIKKTDSLGEDGDFDGKAAYIHRVDSLLPRLLDLKPDVLAVAGDHSTPARLRKHSWHPVPLLLWAPLTARPDGCTSFGESSCAQGGLGTIMATDLMPLIMAHARRLAKYGA